MHRHDRSFDSSVGHEVFLNPKFTIVIFFLQAPEDFFGMLSVTTRNNQLIFAGLVVSNSVISSTGDKDAEFASVLWYINSRHGLQ